MIYANLEYTLPGMCPAWVRQLQLDYSWTYNKLIYAITDIKADIARLDKEFLQ